MAKVYIDTGIFIDFLSQHALGGASLRTGPRRARTPAGLTRDAGKVLTATANDHIGATSCLTFYEVEQALHKVWELQAKGVAGAATVRVLAARSIMPQMAMIVQFYRLQALDLTAAIIAQQLNQPLLHVRGVRAADAVHVCTAVDFGAEILVTADEDILQLDQQVPNRGGKPMRCVDSDVALTLL